MLCGDQLKGCIDLMGTPLLAMTMDEVEEYARRNLLALLLSHDASEH